LTLPDTPREDVVAPLTEPPPPALSRRVTELELRVEQLEEMLGELEDVVGALVPPKDALAEKFQGHLARFRAKEQAGG
jgi:hypothetical protein